MEFIKDIFAGYPSSNVDLKLEDFVYSLSTQNPHFAETLIVLLITFFLGFMVYVYSFILVDREKSAPYPIWMHTFYWAADFMGIFVFLSAYDAVGGFWFFLLGCVGEIVWVGFECYCLWRAVTVEREAIWGKGATLKNAILYCLMQIAVFFVSLNLLRVELGDVSMFKFWIFTQVIIVCAPGMFWKERGTRIGTCWQLTVVLVLVAIMSFMPNHNMWALISPYFLIENNPWFYVVGLVVFCFAIYDVYVYAKLPKKPERLPNGKKPIW
ncbi:MAG: ABC transporter permease [Bacillota bacterium]|nr:ABC transporter permease [Bacillota bacterium]